MLKTPRRPFTAEFKDLAAKRVATGGSLGSVARELGHGQTTLRTWDAMSAPKLVVAVGDCGSGCAGAVFGESYASCGRVANILPVDVAIPGCPPPPLDLLRGILTAIRGRAETAP